MSIADQVSSVNWLRLSDESNFDDYSMWGSDNLVTPNESVQGGLGDCWLVAASASIATDSQRLKDIFKVQETNEVGVYAFQMYLLGTPITVTIDDNLPYNRNQSLLFSEISEDEAVWFPLMEKAAAKYLGSYEAINGGLEESAFMMFLGAPFDWYYNDDYYADELWQLITEGERNNDFITVGSYFGDGGDQSTNQAGVPYSHAFTVLSTVLLKDGTRLVKIRNPWNVETYHGEWYDQSKLWTKRLREEASAVEANDGEYFMAVEDFQKNYEMLTIGHDIQGWQRTHHAIFGDDDPHDRSEVFTDDSTEYNTYAFDLVSSVDQDVYISAYTYGDLQYVATCYETYLASEVFITSDYHPYDMWQANPGAGHLPMISMKAGETVEVEVYTRFGAEDLLPHDWQLVVLASQATVNIYKYEILSELAAVEGQHLDA